MDIPFELFSLLIMSCFAMGIVGIWKKIPMLMVLGGFIIGFLAIMTDNIQLGFSEPEKEQIPNYTLSYPMNQQLSSGVLAYSSTNTIRAEKVNNMASILSETKISCIMMHLSRTGNPTGNVEFGIFDSSGLKIKHFGNITASSLPTTATFQKICLPNHDYYQPSEFDRIGARHTTSSGGNIVSASFQNTNVFDSINSIRSTFISGVWTDTTTEDMTMILTTEELTINETPIENTIELILFEFTQYPKILFTLIGSLLTIGGALAWHATKED